jgi:hypothetical protein
MPDKRRIWLAWLNNWSYADSLPTTPWKGMMSIPREVKLEAHDGQIKLVQKPAEELKVLRKDSLLFQNTNLSVINSSFVNLAFKQFELKAKVAVANKKGFSLQFKKNGSQYSEFIFDFINKEIRFNRANSGKLSYDYNFKNLQVAPLIIENGIIDLHLFVDNSSAELFSAGGQVVMSNQIFPDKLSNRVQLTALDQDILFEEFDVWNFEKQDSLPASPDTTSTIIENFRLFQVYPNPIINSNSVTIRVKNEFVGKVTFKLFNASGMLISEFKPASNSVTIPGSSFATSKGLYFLKGSKGSKTQTEKLLVLSQ